MRRTPPDPLKRHRRSAILKSLFVSIVLTQPSCRPSGRMKSSFAGGATVTCTDEIRGAFRPSRACGFEIAVVVKNQVRPTEPCVMVRLNGLPGLFVWCVSIGCCRLVRQRHRSREIVVIGNPVRKNRVSKVCVCRNAGHNRAPPVNRLEASLGGISFPFGSGVPLCFSRRTPC